MQRGRALTAFGLSELMEPPTCLIVADGVWPQPAVIASALRGPTTVLACDGALARCHQHGLTVHAVVGDMDSLDAEDFLQMDDVRVVERLDQNSNDLSKAIDHALEEGHMNLRIVGATGGDVQHEWANVLECARRDVNIELMDDRSRFLFLAEKEQHEVPTNLGGTFSLMAFVDVEMLNLSGGEYSISNDRLAMGSRGLHNVANEAVINLSYDSGRLVLILPQ